MHSAIHNGTLAHAPIAPPRYQTPIADAARARTRRLMATHMRSQRIELLACTLIFAVLGFATAYQL